MRSLRLTFVTSSLLVVTIVALITLATLDSPRAAQGIPSIPTLPPLGVALIVDTVDDTGGLDGKCSLREAINATNINGTDNDCDASLSQPGGTDFITFNIGAGNPVINTVTVLPTIIDKVTIDGSGGAPRVVLHGPGDGNVVGPGINFGAGAAGSTITRMVINNFGWGVYIAGANDVNVKGNYLGTNADGTIAMHNQNGVYAVLSSNARIGGTNGVTPGGACTGDCNLISGNAQYGIYMINHDAAIVSGNFIGTNSAGTGAVPNNVGVRIDGGGGGGGAGSVIGGTADGAGNLISGNAIGIEVANTSNVSIQGNRIGTQPDDASALGNLAQGILFFGLLDNATNNIVGGQTTESANIIAFNGQPGVHVSGAINTGNAIRGNSIFSNAKGIENSNGGNTELAPPVIIGATASGAHGNGCVGCQIDIYSDDDDEGRLYHGFATTNVGGKWVYSGALSGPHVTATANDLAGNTSEFSLPFTLPATPTPTPSPNATATVTPSPTPSSTPIQTPVCLPGGAFCPQLYYWGDNNCDLNVDPTDALLDLRADAASPIAPIPDCFDLKSVVEVAGFSPHTWGDVDCNGDVTSFDALAILRYFAGVSNAPNDDCPQIGSIVAITVAP